MSTLMTKLENIESMLDEMNLRIQATVPERDREYLYSGVRTIKNDLYQAMREAITPEDDIREVLEDYLRHTRA